MLIELPLERRAAQQDTHRHHADRAARVAARIEHARRLRAEQVAIDLLFHAELDVRAQRGGGRRRATFRAFSIVSTISAVRSCARARGGRGSASDPRQMLQVGTDR